MPSPQESSSNMTLPAASRPRPAPDNNQHVSGFFELQQRVKNAGLMERRVGAYIFRMVVLGLAFVGAFALVVALGNTWWQLAVAALFGVLFTQVAFLAHDGAHQQIFAAGRHNAWFSRIAGNLVVGMSYGWWTRKHGRHHAHPNTVGKDDDIATGTLVFVPEEAKNRSGFMGWLTRRQGWLFFPLLTLFALALHYTSVKSIVQNPKLKYRKTELALLALRFTGFPVLMILLLGPGLGAAFMGVQLMVFGVYMGGSFAPNHKGMPLIPKDAKVDFLTRQVLTSRNIRGGRIVDWAMGGLNYQIEHHLFPRMPSANLHQVRQIVREHCAEQGIPYTETGLIEAYRIVIKYLNRVGLGEADPMECPLITQLRPR
ncbi:fatty acid desaturase family protein [Yaniella flava]